jgi:hypothetical protein
MLVGSRVQSLRNEMEMSKYLVIEKEGHLS